MKKRLLALMLAAAMVIPVTPFALASEADKTEPSEDSVANVAASATETGGASEPDSLDNSASSMPEAQNGVITLTEDVTLTESWEVTAETTITLNLNGHTLSVSGNAAVIKNHGSLTIQDTSTGQNGKITGYRGVDNYGALTLESGTIHGTSPYDATIQFCASASADTASFTMNGGTVTSLYTNAIGFTSNTIPASTTITLEGGTVGGILLKGNTTLTVGESSEPLNHSKIAVGAITTFPNNTHAHTLNLYSGIIEKLPSRGWSAPTVTYAVTTALIADNSVCPDGYHFDPVNFQEKSYYQLKENTVAVAELCNKEGTAVETKYYSVLDAVDDLQEGYTLKLLTDYTITYSSQAINIKVPNVTLDLNGYDITSSVSISPVRCSGAASGTFTITNSSPTGTSSSIASSSDTISDVSVGSDSSVTLKIDTNVTVGTVGLNSGARMEDTVPNRALVAADGNYDNLYAVTLGGTAYIYGGSDLSAIGIDANQAGTAEVTATLLGNATNGISYGNSSVTLTVDLDGHVVTGVGNTAVGIPSGADGTSLTVRNGTVRGAISAAGASSKNCTLVLENLNMTSNGDAGVGANGAMSDGLKLTLTNCTLTSTNGNNMTTGIFFPVGNGELTIENSTITGYNTGVQAYAGSVTITGENTVITGSGVSVPNFDDETGNLMTTGPIFDGAAVSIIDRNTDYGELSSVKIDGGSFQTDTGSAEYGAVHIAKEVEGNSGTFEEFNNTSSGNQIVQVSGGTFSTPIAPEFCATDKAPLVKADGSCSIITPSEDAGQGYIEQDGTYYENEDALAATYVAKVGDTYYSTMEDAIDKVGQGETIYVIKDIPNATGISVPTGKNFTIDFGGHTYTLSGPGAGSTNTETNGFQLLKGSDITFKNGTIRIAENANNIKKIIQNYANLTLEDMHIYAENQVGGEEYALSFNFGNIVFKGDTDIITTDDDTAVFDVYFWNNEIYQNGVSVTFDETYTGTINGTIIYDSTDPDKAALIIQGSGYIGAVDTSRLTSNGNNIQIFGGSFGESVAEYVVDELNAELNSNGTYTYYETVADALAHANPGDKITDLSGSSTNPETPVPVYTVTYVNGDNTWSEKVLGDSRLTLPDLETQGYYYFCGWKDDRGNFYYSGDSVTIKGNVTFTAVWDYIPPIVTDPSYAISVPAVSNGTVTVNPASAQQGITVTVTAVPNQGYELASLTVTDRFGNTVMTQANPNGTYSFVMPGSQVTVTAVFVETAPGIWVNPFVDVASTDWFYSYVEYVCQNGLMNGTSAVTFEPASTVTRGTVATILWRMAGSPVVNYLMTFPDVAGDEWYGEATRWAASEGVITGYDNGNFAPNDPITREQLAVMLYRYAQKQGQGFTGAWAFPLDYADAEQVSAYAYESMCWMTMNGVIAGKDGNRLDPQGTATRSELAAMLARFCEII